MNLCLGGIIVVNNNREGIKFTQIFDYDVCEEGTQVFDDNR